MTSVYLSHLVAVLKAPFYFHEINDTECSIIYGITRNQLGYMKILLSVRLKRVCFILMAKSYVPAQVQ